MSRVGGFARCGGRGTGPVGSVQAHTCKTSPQHSLLFRIIISPRTKGCTASRMLQKRAGKLSLAWPATQNGVCEPHPRFLAWS